MKSVGIVGLGAIAQAYLKVLQGCDFAKIAGVADVRANAVAPAAELANCNGYSSYQELAAKERLDAVIVCTPPSTHPEVATYFLKGGVPVLCEKPFAIDRQGAQAIADAAKGAGVTVTMASKFRYVEDVIRLKSIVTSGLLGEVQLLENAFVSPVNMRGRWNSQPEISGGGVLVDNGTHSVDIVRYLLGPIAEVLTVTETCAEELPVEDSAFVMLRTDGGTSARIDLSWSFDKQLPHFISVYGTNGTAHVGWRTSRYKQHSNSDWTTFGNGYDKMEAFRNNLRNFCSSLDRKEKLLITVDDALASVETIQAAYESARTSTWAKVATTPLKART